jgi:hypothetical protein
MQNNPSSQNGKSVKLFMLPKAMWVVDQEKHQVFAIDRVENRNGQTIWTHKADAWLQLFTADKELVLEGGHRADPFFHNLLVGCQRSQPKGPNVQKQVTTKNNKTIDFQVLWGMTKCNDDTEATLKTELMKFSTLASDPEIQEACHVTVRKLWEPNIQLHWSRSVPPKCPILKLENVEKNWVHVVPPPSPQFIAHQ